MNALDHVPGLCGRIATELARLPEAGQSRAYDNLEPGHRARLQAEDAAKVHTEVAKLKATLLAKLAEARSTLLALGIRLNATR